MIHLAPRTSRHALLSFVATVALAASGSCWIGCAGRRALSAEETHAQASEYFESGAYELAIESYKDLLDQHPFTEHAADAELKTAQAYYLMGRYAEATAAFSDFERMHPTSPQVPVVTYYLGMSYLKQMRPEDRDQEPSDKAHAYFAAVIDRYPGSPWAERARLRLRECDETLAAHELYVANFYLRRKNLPAAEARFGHLLRNYPNTDAAAEGLFRLGYAYAEQGLHRPAALAYRVVLARHAEAPIAGDARRMLDEIPAGVADGDGDPLEALLAERLARTAAATDAGFTPGVPGPSFTDPSSNGGTGGGSSGEAAEPGMSPPQSY
jgi:outer membrane protein assembly factor BamD